MKRKAFILSRYDSIALKLCVAMTQATFMPTMRVPEHTYPVMDSARSRDLKKALGDRIEALGAVLVAHYYTDGHIQDLAEQTGGVVADSLEMARFGRDHSADVLVVAGVRFMGETAKILSPNKTVLMPALEATCSLDLGCPAEEFTSFCDANQDRIVVVYANTSAAVKARSDWVVTSRNAVDVVNHLSAQGEKIIWAPDRHLGHYVQQQTHADMLIWEGACVVHEEFKAKGIQDLKLVYPDAAVLVHPESPAGVIDLADEVGSTTQLIEAVRKLPNKICIVATDRGLFHQMQKAAPEKTLIEAPTAGNGATCKSCAHCPWMAMNQLDVLHRALVNKTSMATCEIQMDAGLAKQATQPLMRMLDFSAQKQAPHATNIPLLAQA